jgi:hypothetical protein
MILGSSSLFLLLTAQSLFSLTFAAKEESLEEQKLKHLESATVAWIADTFRTPKKIAFACYLGGSSHVYWVLSIAEELSMRGHSTFFFTKVKRSTFLTLCLKANAIIYLGRSQEVW